MKPSQKDDPIVVTEVERGIAKAVLIGDTPLILNRLSEKAKHELLMPKGRKTTAEKASSLKHDPLAEFRAAPHYAKKETDFSLGKTLLAIPAAAPKKAMASAALDIPGAKKAQIGRLVWVPGEYLPVYGTPELYMSVVRNSDMNHTPDIRTRVILRNWMVPLSIHFVGTVINLTTLINLLSAAGLFIGVGDYRNEKGAGNYGQFTVLSEAKIRTNDKAIQLLKEGYAVQKAAMDNPKAYDDETEELLTWFNAELKVRGKKVA